VSPRLAISILFLRAYEKVSWVEALERTQDDRRWKVALGLEMEEEPKSTLQEFEARLVIPEKEKVDGGGAACRLSAESQDAGGPGHHADLGPGGGEGHLQSVGGRGRTVGLPVGGGGRRELGGAARVESLF
jgi:hypothetical protein